MLARYLLAAAVVAGFAAHRPVLRQMLRLPDRPGGWAVAWLLPAQTMAAGVVVALSVWLSLGFDTLTDRLAGPLAAAVLLPSGVFLAGLGESQRIKLGNWSRDLRFATLAAGV